MLQINSGPMKLELWYQRIWGNLNIAVSILFSIIFILGAVILNDAKFLLYLIFTAVNGYIGYKRLTVPYVVCTEETPGKNGEIIVYNSYGALQYTYRYQSRDEITVQGNRLYQGNKKLRFNSWFTKNHEWEKIVQYYATGTLPVNELQEI
jgi:hypothetical protein